MHMQIYIYIYIYTRIKEHIYIYILYVLYIDRHTSHAHIHIRCTVIHPYALYICIYTHKSMYAGTCNMHLSVLEQTEGLGGDWLGQGGSNASGRSLGSSKTGFGVFFARPRAGGGDLALYTHPPPLQRPWGCRVLLFEQQQRQRQQHEARTRPLIKQHGCLCYKWSIKQ